MAGALIDTRRYIATPEGIELEIALAGPVPRALAWALDFAIRLAALIALSVVLGVFGAFGTAVLLIAWFLLEWFYPVFFEVRFDGATPGKRAFGLVVLNDDGTPVRLAASTIRNLLRAADFLPFLYGFGLLAMLTNRDFQRLGDLAANTVVAYRAGDNVKRRVKRARKDQMPVMATMSAPLAPSFALNLAEQRAVIDFAERRSLLTEERAEELARIATPLLAGAEADPAARLSRIASFLTGRR